MFYNMKPPSLSPILPVMNKKSRRMLARIKLKLNIHKDETDNTCVMYPAPDRRA